MPRDAVGLPPRDASFENRVRNAPPNEATRQLCGGTPRPPSFPSGRFSALPLAPCFSRRAGAPNRTPSALQRAFLWLATLFAAPIAAATPLLDIPVSQVAISDDGRYLAAASSATHLSFFDLEHTRLLADLPTSSTITCLAFSPAEPLLAAGSEDGSVAAFRLPAAARDTRFVAHPRPVLAIAFDPSGRMIATAGADAAVGVWIARNGTQRALLAGHSDLATGVAWSGEADLLSASWDGTVRRWDYARTFTSEVLHRSAARLRALAIDAAGLPIFGTEDGMPGTASRGPVTSILRWRGRTIAAHDNGTVWRVGDAAPSALNARKLAADAAGARIAAAGPGGLVLFTADEFAAQFP